MIFALVMVAILILNTIIVYKMIKHADQIYSYKNIIYYGISIFNWIFIVTMTVLNIRDFNFSFRAFESNALAFGQVFSTILLPIIALGFIPVIASNIYLIRHESKKIKNLLGIILFFIFVLVTLLAFMINGMFTDYKVYTVDGIYILCIEVLLKYTGAYIITYLECMFLGTIICSLVCLKRKTKYDKDFIIILGCQIKKDGTLTNLLKGRVDKAVEFSKEQMKKTGKKVIFIPSGGQGEDEVISEAEAMKNYLIQVGIDENDIIIEDKSTSTFENMSFSKDIIDKINPAPNVLFSTTNYHVYRAGVIAQKVELNCEGIGSKTKWYFWPNAFLREFIGVIWSEKKFHSIAIAVLTTIISLTTLRHYMF